MPGPGSPADRLRTLLAEDRLYVTPSCFDALSAKMIERAGFDLAFMSGFAVSAARLGMPDTGLISYGEILDTGRNVCDAVDIPVIGDADTGYGNPINAECEPGGSDDPSMPPAETCPEPEIDDEG